MSQCTDTNDAPVLVTHGIVYNIDVFPFRASLFRDCGNDINRFLCRFGQALHLPIGTLIDRDARNIAAQSTCLLCTGDDARRINRQDGVIIPVKKVDGVGR